MPNRIRTLLATAGICAGLVVPTTAAAGVGQHIRNADDALAKAEQLVERSQDARAAVRMARANVQARRAAADARALPLRREARADRRVARQFNQNAETDAALIDEVRPAVQDDVADAVQSALRGRDRALAVLAGLLERLPAHAVAGITSAMASIVSGSDATDELSTALDSGAIAPVAEDDVQQALDRAAASLQAVVERLQALVGELPPAAQVYVNQVIDRIGSVLGSIASPDIEFPA